MEAMASFPDKHFELAIVDPPYNGGASDGNFGRNDGTYRKDMKHYANHCAIPEKTYFDELFRISKNYIVWGANYYSQYFTHSGCIVWDKMKDCNPVLSDCELAYQSLDKMVKIFRFEWYGFNKGSGSFEGGHKQVIHPNQKPVALYKWLLTKYAKPGDKILDTHAGSCSSVIACLDLGFDIWAYELDKDYYQAASKRITDFTNQIKLF